MATVDELIWKLENGNPIQRQHAAQELGKLGEPQAIEPLVEAMLHDRDKTVRSTAAVWLGKMGNPEAIPSLAQVVLTDGEDPEIRAYAAYALSDIRHANAIPVLIEASYTPDLHVRFAAVQSLAQFPDPKVIPALIDRLGNDYYDTELVALSALRKHILIHPDAILKPPQKTETDWDRRSKTNSTKNSKMNSVRNHGENDDDRRRTHSETQLGR